MIITGQVVHVNQAVTGPVLRSPLGRLTRWLALAVLLSSALVTAAVLRLTRGLIESLVPSRRTQNQRGFFAEYLNDTLAHLTAQRIGNAGTTLIAVARVQNAAGFSVPVRFEGHAISGSPALGDDVEIFARVVDGVNVATGGQNYTVGEPIRFRR